VPTLPLLLCVAAVASMFWAEVSGGGPRALLFAVVTLSGVAVGNFLAPREAMRIFDYGLRVTALASFALWVVFPELAIDQGRASHGTLLGIYPHKNSLSAMLLLGVVTLLNRTKPDVSRQSKIAWTVFYVVLMAFSKSATALGLLLLCAVLNVIVRSWRRLSPFSRTLSLLAYLGATFLIVVFLLSRSDEILGVFGRDSTLSGRSRIWEGTYYAWKLRPLFGYGWWVAFDERSEASRTIYQFTQWYVPNAHNSFLTMLLFLGLFGMVLLVAFSLAVLFRCLLGLVRNFTLEGSWQLQIVTIFILHSLFDSWLDKTYWFLMVLISVWSIRYGKSRMESPKLELL